MKFGTRAAGVLLSSRLGWILFACCLLPGVTGAEDPPNDPASLPDPQVPAEPLIAPDGSGLEAGAPKEGTENAVPADSGPPQAHVVNQGLRILILGDSMGMNGFCDRLDANLRKMPEVESVNTYMACGTNPRSWLKRKPYTTIKTRCGYWSIEDGRKGGDPKVVKDVYGMKRGHRPRAWRVPKLEDLVARHQPQILIMQSGNNLFGCFKDKKTIRESTHSKSLKWYLDPFIDDVSRKGTSLRKIYWITPPEAGSVTKDIQTFIYEKIKDFTTPFATPVDSRKVTSFPYRSMAPDKEHFWGKEALQWSDDILKVITDDLNTTLIKDLPTLDKVAEKVRAQEKKVEEAVASAILLKVRINKITKTPAPETFAPYQEVLVGYRYDVEEVLKGEYEEKSVLVMHPAYIRLKPQDLGKYQKDEPVVLTLSPFDEGSIWNGIRTRDDTDSFDLLPYLLTEDEFRHPDAGSEKENATSQKTTGQENKQ